MIILRSIIDGFNIMMGTTFMHAALVVAYFTYWY